MDAVARAISSGDDLYALLGVDPGASDEDIRHAYRALARRYHPDANPGDGRPDGFRRIAAAYEVLGDERERAAYDRARWLELLGAGREVRPGPMAAHAAPRPTGVPSSRGRAASPNPADHAPHVEHDWPRLRQPVDEWRLVSLLGRVVAAVAALMVIALVALVVVSANAREPEPPPPTMWCKTPDGWYDCWEATSPDGR